MKSMGRTLIAVGIMLFAGCTAADNQPPNAIPPSMGAISVPPDDPSTLPSTSTAPPTTPKTAVALPHGLLCQDLKTRGMTYAQAVAYWHAEGDPARMDADSNGVPCETVWPATTVCKIYDTACSGPNETTAPPGGTDPRFSTCKAANAAGYGPYTRGVDPEYGWYRDQDSDGISCER